MLFIPLNVFGNSVSCPRSINSGAEDLAYTVILLFANHFLKPSASFVSNLLVKICICNWEELLIHSVFNIFFPVTNLSAITYVYFSVDLF